MAERIEIAANGLVFPALAAGEGPLVLLLHGFPESPESFAGQIPALAAAGYRAVAPTMRGYAPSCQPADGDYHAVRMAEDVAAIADALGADRFHLVGHDWGANIAFAATALAPARVRTLTAIAVPHPARFGAIVATDAAQQARSGYVFEFLTPEADARLAADDFAWLERLWRSWSPGWAEPDAALATVKTAFRQPGVIAAALGYYRQAFDPDSPAALASQALLAGPFAAPTLGIVGEDDGCIAADVFAAAMDPADFPVGLRVERIAGAGHFVQCERPDAVNALLLDWLARG